MSPTVHVLGSLNLDVVAEVERIPAPGETVHAVATREDNGGKGANQAVAAARAGADTRLVGAVGDDPAGERLLTGLAAEGIDTTGVLRSPRAVTGQARITVQASGENTIVVVPGANGSLSPDDAARALRGVRPGDVLLLQLEIPLATVVEAAGRARSAGATVVLNAAPGAALPGTLLSDLDVLVVNEHELRLVEGSDEPLQDAALRLAGTHSMTVVVTLGALGALIVEGDTGGTTQVASPVVDAVDTTGAGDTFVGYLAAALCAGSSVSHAAPVAAAAGALAVTRPGAQGAIPTASAVRNQPDRSI